MAEFKLLRGGLQDQFLALRTKIQLFGGGFGNGKTTAVVGKTLQISQDYPGANILMARSTYPKLNDTLRKEFMKWCPKDWIKSFPMSVNASNLCTLTNGTTIPFRYIAQQGKQEESSTSNLLSATYDLIVVDQAEDPEISFKDFLDLMGRLRGNTPYRGTDPTFPRSGPRWMLLTVNPTRNWVYTELVAPYHAYKNEGKITEKLLCIRDPETTEPTLINGKPQLLIDIIEGSTYENKHNVEHDFIQGLESTYRGQQKDRYLLGKWAAYEGLVYPQFSESDHMIGEKYIKRYLNDLIEEGYDIEWEEGYDHGLAAPSCYLLSFVDPHGNVIVVDGFYKKEFSLEDTHESGQFTTIKKIRGAWGADEGNIIQADPDIFRRKGAGKVGTTVGDLFWSDGDLLVTRADNSITHGITKVGSYLNPRLKWVNPFTRTNPAPSIYFNSKLQFIADEMGSYFWRRNNVTGEREDQPQDGNDHALDTIKYLLTRRPEASKLKPSAIKTVPAWMRWNEQESNENIRSRRHG
jgi:hypothetical protein